jgi:hypothetical protein
MKLIFFLFSLFALKKQPVRRKLSLVKQSVRGSLEIERGGERERDEERRELL